MCSNGSSVLLCCSVAACPPVVQEATCVTMRCRLPCVQRRRIEHVYVPGCVCVKGSVRVCKWARMQVCEYANVCIHVCSREHACVSVRVCVGVCVLSARTMGPPMKAAPIPETRAHMDATPSPTLRTSVGKSSDVYT